MSTETLVHIYGLHDPRSGICRYIGKTNNPNKRFKDHLCKSLGDNPHKKNWILSLRAAGLRPRLEILRTVPADGWKTWERAFIQEYRKFGFDLTNALDGGDNPPDITGRKQTLEHKEKRAAALRGRKRPIETLLKMSAALKGKSHKHSPEVIEKIRTANVGKFVSLETRLRISESHAKRGHRTHPIL